MFVDQRLNRVFLNLTAKQREVLDLLAEGLTSKEIARELSVSPSAIDQRLKGLKEKLGATNRAEIARLYQRADISVLGQDDQAIILDALTPDDAPAGPADKIMPVLSVPDASTQRPGKRQMYPFITDIRFLGGYLCGFLSGLAIACASFTTTLIVMLKAARAAI